MTLPTSVLEDLHTLLLRIRAVSEELEESPRQTKRLQTRVTAAEKALADHLTAIKTAKINVHDREVSVKASRDQLKKYERDVEGNVSKKEYDALNIEIASLKKRISDLDDEGLELLASVDELTAKTGSFEQTIVQAKAVFNKAKAEQEETLPALKARLAEAQQLLVEKKTQLPDEWRSKFLHLESSDGADALASMNGRSCSACYTDVTAQQFSMISQGKVEACKSCGKMLYQTR